MQSEEDIKQKKELTLATSLLGSIKMKLNPIVGGRKGFEHKVSFGMNCSVADYCALFPNSQLQEKSHSSKFSSRRKLSEVSFKQLSMLDGVLGKDWDIVYNKTSVGFCLPPVTIRLYETQLNSCKSKLSYDIKVGTQSEVIEIIKTHNIRISFYRAAISRWTNILDPKTQCYAEADWLPKLRELQRKNVKLCKKRNKIMRKINH